MAVAMKMTAIVSVSTHLAASLASFSDIYYAKANLMAKS